jgi:hypothetical protein
MYKAVMEMMPHERPDDTIINDDVKFDRWCEQFTREQAVKLAKLHDSQKQTSGLTDEQKRKSMPMFGGPRATDATPERSG